MYNIKQVINKMKKIANINSNVELANTLGISYNTLNTWIKRNKLPQETIFEFKDRYNISLDYLLLDTADSDNNIPNYKSPERINHNKTNIDSIIKYNYYGEFSELSIKFSTILYVDKDKKHNNGYYLIKSNNITYIAKVQFSFTSEFITLVIDNNTHVISIEEFNIINCGLITNIKLKEENKI